MWAVIGSNLSIYALEKIATFLLAYFKGRSKKAETVPRQQLEQVESMIRSMQANRAAKIPADPKRAEELKRALYDLRITLK